MSTFVSYVMWFREQFNDALARHELHVRQHQYARLLAREQELERSLGGALPAVMRERIAKEKAELIQAMEECGYRVPSDLRPVRSPMMPPRRVARG